MDFPTAMIYFGGLPFLVISAFLPRPKDAVMMIVGWLAAIAFSLPWLFSLSFVLIEADHWRLRRIQRAIFTLDENAPLAIFWWISAIAGFCALLLVLAKLTKLRPSTKVKDLG